MENNQTDLVSIPNEYRKNYLKNAAAHKQGMNNQQVVDYYNKWAINYDQDLDINVYRGPQIAADVINIFLWDKNASILDIGSGTGFVGYFMKKHGFYNIDGLEPSESMLNIAKSKNIYQNLFMEGISSDKETSLSTESYDACILSGSFGEGHIPSEGLKEILRLTKKNGYVIIVMRKEYLQNVKEYADKLEPLMEKMEIKRVWNRVTCFDIENYSFNKTGIVYVFKKN